MIKFSMYEKALEAVKSNKSAFEFYESMYFVVIYFLRTADTLEFTIEYPGEVCTVSKDKGQYSILYPGVASAYVEEQIKELSYKCYRLALRNEQTRLNKLQNLI